MTENPFPEHVLQNLSPDQRKALLKRAVEPLWLRGDLEYLLDETQRQIRQALRDGTERKFMLLCSRRLGKSYTLIVEDIETAVKTPGSRILYLAPYAKDAADIVRDIAAPMLQDCPEELKPRYLAQDRAYEFANGSLLRFKGVNNDGWDALRGGAADLVILDECGSMDNLSYGLQSVVMPMVMTTGGRILLATTPPKTPGHDSATVYEDLASRGQVVTFTILDNPRISDDVKAEFLREAGEKDEDIPGILAGTTKAKTTTALREYFCEFVTDAASKVLPEFDSEAEADIVIERLRPPFFDGYVAMDPGMQDRTGILFAYLDFIRGKIVIEDELLLHQATTLTIAEQIRSTEARIWAGKEPYKRVSDVDLRLIADLRQLNDLRFNAIQKQDSLGAVNFVRNLIQTRQIEINPRCKHLIRQMKNAIWNNKVTDFARAGEKSLDGHYDLVAALKYLCRGVDFSRNPYPEGFQVRPRNTFVSPRAPWLQKDKGKSLYLDTPFARKLRNSRQ